MNIQPVHMAILEGEKEIILTEKTFLDESFNKIPLHIRPRGFFKLIQLWPHHFMLRRVVGLEN